MVDSTRIGDFPFRSVLSLRLLIGYWENAILSGQVPFGEPLLAEIRKAAELREPVADRAVLERHRDLITFLMTAVFAPAQADKELAAATVPFHFDAIFETRGFQRNIDLDLIRRSASINIPGNDMVVGKTIHACLLILQQFYGVKINFDKPILFTLPNPATGLDKVYRIEIGRQFFEIVSHGTPPPIDPRIIKFLTEKVYDVDLWLQYIRPENFEFRGFMIMRMVDVTEQEMVSAIKYDLLEKDAVSKTDSFITIQRKLRSIFAMPDIRLGLAYFDADNNIILRTEEKRKDWKNLTEKESEITCESCRGSIYERTWMEKRYITVEDIEIYPYKTPVEEALLSNGIRNILLAPLMDEGEPIGILELSSSTPGELNPVTANKVDSILPMFTAAVKRVKEEMTTEVRAIIQEECTNIHPVVQWRFLEVGRKVLEKRRRGEPATFDEITFRDVYPLFGMTDIRNSSLERSAAIRQDLMQNLQMVKSLLQRIHQRMNLPVLDEALFRISRQMLKISEGMASGDETSAVEFLKREVNPLLVHFENEPDFRADINGYRGNLDPVFGVVYRRRRDFEQSLGKINEMISTYLNEAQAESQEMFPHYFEKNQTDGIEYTIYLGTSLVRNREFNAFYLKNFRLWQLMVTCEIERRMAELKGELKIDLDITHLILVHDQPLSIRFRHDEKKFDVDGAYDIRYEIIKKRIDKATVRFTGERVTQPGKIAVIYNQPEVGEEYRKYFEYLATKGLVSPAVEVLELDELPGANGLSALRVDITLKGRRKPQPRDLVRGIESALQLQ